MISPNIAKKLSRSETAERHTLLRGVSKSLRRRSKGSGWGCNRGVLFRDQAGWFVEIWTIVHVRGPRQLSLAMHVKPMALDPIFWAIAELPENGTKPLSFRSLGAWTCRAESVFEARIPILEPEADEIARDVLRWGDENLLAQHGQWELASFIEAVRLDRRTKFVTLVSALIIDGRMDEARSLCLEAESANNAGGFLWSVPAANGPTHRAFATAARSYLDRAAS